MDFIVDFTCGFYGFHMKSTWFHMKDQEKGTNLTWISCSDWFQVDFMKPARFQCEIHLILWNLLNFSVKSARFQWNPLNVMPGSFKSDNSRKKLHFQRGGKAMSFELCETLWISLKLERWVTLRFKLGSMPCRKAASYLFEFFRNSS